MYLPKAKLKVLNKESFRNIQDNVKASKEIIKLIQDQFGMDDYCEALCFQSKEVNLVFDNTPY